MVSLLWQVDVYLSDGTLLDGQVYACDFHYNLALVKIESDALLQPASLRNLDDSISIHPCEIQSGMGSLNLFSSVPILIYFIFVLETRLLLLAGTLRNHMRLWLPQGNSGTRKCLHAVIFLNKNARMYPIYVGL